MTDPASIPTMAELRVEIDRLDSALIDLLARRAACIDRAIQLKPAEGMPARIDARVAQVIDNVREKAKTAGVSPDLAEAIWRTMVEHFIAREEAVLGQGTTT